ncbi:class I SAM-dependent methyltransferase [Vibrio owensii]|uniref:class I SAM-dependent methyltransferase n=1 Tax=Vibrio owensii TaxID=696485 RepID=UPI0018F1E951|nr:class I SAM-dependent methyltransferase [Vibrio owensii]
MSRRYYQEENLNYIKQTINLPMEEHTLPFMEHVADNGGNRILDVGCGSGRDLKTFTHNEFDCLGVEPDEFFAEYAELFSGAKVAHCDIRHFVSDKKFDGVWCSASLIHIPREELTGVLERLGNLMHKDSIFYASFKLGKDYSDGRRDFTCFDRDGIHQLFHESPLKVSIVYLSSGNGSSWINVLAKLRG